MVPVVQDIERVRIRHEDRRWLYIRQHPLAITVYVFSLLSALVLVLFSDLDNTSALVDFLPKWLEQLWIFMYGLGGLMGAMGAWRLRARQEAVGAVMLGWVWLVDAWAIFIERGQGAVFVQSVLVATSVGLIIRAVIIYRDTMRDDV